MKKIIDQIMDIFCSKVIITVANHDIIDAMKLTESIDRQEAINIIMQIAILIINRLSEGYQIYFISTRNNLPTKSVEPSSMKNIPLPKEYKPGDKGKKKHSTIVYYYRKNDQKIKLALENLRTITGKQNADIRDLIHFAVSIQKSIFPHFLEKRETYLIKDLDDDKKRKIIQIDYDFTKG